MSTLEDLANAIDSAAQDAAPKTAMIQSGIVTAISGLTNLSVSEIYSFKSPDYFEDLAQGLRQLLVAKLEERFLEKIIASITPVETIVVTAGIPVAK
jgi:hypothetical protein